MSSIQGIRFKKSQNTLKGKISLENIKFHFDTSPSKGYIEKDETRNMTEYFKASSFIHVEKYYLSV